MKNFICLVIMIVTTTSIDLCFCLRNGHDTDSDGVCAAASSIDGDCDVIKERPDIIPPSWVVYLHNIEDAKLNHAKGCKDNDVILNDISIHCSFAETIQKDLKIFNTIRESDLDTARGSDRHSVSYRLFGGRLYRSQDFCLFPSRCEGIEHFLLKLKDRLPNLEIVVNTHDWPFINRHFYPKPVPLFSFSKTVDHYDIYFPAWTFWAGGPAIKQYPTGLGRWDLMRKTLEISHDELPWSKKMDKAFFRGSRTSSERDNLVTLSAKKPDLIDAKFTKNQAWKSAKDTLGMDPAPEAPLEDHCRFRFLFNFRGVAASFRHKHLFLCGSLVFHVGDDWNEFYYGGLRPWYHYIPVPSEASEAELEDLVLFAQNHPEISQTIALNGRSFIEKHLRMEDVENYWLVLLKSYSKLLDFEVKKPNEKFIEVK